MHARENRPILHENRIANVTNMLFYRESVKEWCNNHLLSVAISLRKQSSYLADQEDNIDKQ